MSEAKHTPGEWWAGTDEDANIVYDADSMRVAETTRDDGDDVQETANARLIAATPDLLALALRVVERFDGSTEPSEEALATQAKDVITKAKGAP